MLRSTNMHKKLKETKRGGDGVKVLTGCLFTELLPFVLHCRVNVFLYYYSSHETSRVFLFFTSEHRILVSLERAGLGYSLFFTMGS